MGCTRIHNAPNRAQKQASSVSRFFVIFILAVTYFVCLNVLYSTSITLHMGLTPLHNRNVAWLFEALPWALVVCCAILVSRVAARINSVIVSVCILGGLALISSIWLTIQPLSYSMDVLRYLWDGRLWMHGLSPYDYVPVDARIASLRKWPYWSNLAWKNWPEAYPPLAQAYFWLVAWLSNGTISAYKWFMFCNGWISNFLFYWVLLERRWSCEGGQTSPAKRLTCGDITSLGLVLLFPPLLVESYGTGHVDAWALPYVLWAWLAAIKRRPIQLGFAIAMATSIKLFPLVLFAAFWKRGEWPYAAKSLIGFLVGILTVILPFSHGLGHITKFVGNVSQMDYNGSLEFVLKKIFGGVIDSHSTTLIAVAALFAWILILCSRAHHLSMEQKASLLGLTFFLASPVVHPWYFVVLIPFAVVGRDFAVLWLAVASHFTYDEVPLDMYVEYIPAYVMYLYRWIEGVRSGRSVRLAKETGGGR